MNMKPTRYQYRLRQPYADPQEEGAPPPVYSRTVEQGMIIERNVVVKMRDGLRLYADVFRPADERPGPPIVAWTPYGKHWYGELEKDPHTAVRDDMLSHYATFEGPDPLYWVPRGYVIVNVDARGTWYSEGTATFLSPEEAEAFYDLIEWAGTQPWSNGKVGLTGVSYLSQSQWKTAALQPPHLAAMNIWEGWSDTYREVARHGGIPDTSFWTKCVATAWGVSTHPIEDIVEETLEHPLFDDFWKSKVADFSKIVTPAFIVASWTDQGLHERGTLEGFKGLASKHKWLEVHGRKKWSYYYEPKSIARLQALFDKFLMGIDSPVDTWPKVLVEVREKYCVGDQHDESEWPIARTEYTKLHLDARGGQLLREPVPVQATCRYDSLGGGPGTHRAEFDFVFEKATELTGHMKLKLYMAAESADDMDIFVGIYKFDARGELVPFAYYAYFNDGPVALGWLRASHRELDRARSTEYQPVLLHQRELKLEPGVIAPLEIEIWPSGTLFEAGSRLRLIVQGTDIQKYSKIRHPVYTRHEDSVNHGRHVIHTGGATDSYLLIPVVPPR
jgi:predicted acyl esterase